LPWVLDNASRPMIGYALPREARYLPAGESIFNAPRTDVYFAKRPELEKPYSEAVGLAAATGCTEIGLWTGAADWEYTLRALGNMSGSSIRVDQIMVHNESAQLARPGGKPCLLVVVVPDKPPSIQLNGVTFTRLFVENGV